MESAYTFFDDDMRKELTAIRNCRKITAQTSKPFMMYDHP